MCCFSARKVVAPPEADKKKKKKSVPGGNEVKVKMSKSDRHHTRQGASEGKDGVVVNPPAERRRLWEEQGSREKRA